MNADKLAQAIERTARHRAATDGIDPDQWRVVLYKWEAKALAEHDARPAQAAQPSADAEDAARYRWLRSVWGRQIEIVGTGECNFGISTPTWRGPWLDLDAAIDAASAAEGDGK